MTGGTNPMAPYAVVEIEGFEQMFVTGRTVKVVIVDKVMFLRQERGVTGKPQHIVLPFEEGQGTLGSNDHLARGFPHQAPIPYPQGVDYVENPVQQRTVPTPSHATGKIARIVLSPVELAAVDGVAWDEMADRMAQVQVGSIYKFVHIGLERANQKYTRANHLWQIQIMKHTLCGLMPDNAIILRQFYKYRRLNTLEPLPANRQVGKHLLCQNWRQLMKYNAPLDNVNWVDAYLYNDSLIYMHLCTFGQPYMDQLQMCKGQVVTIKGVLIDKFHGSVSLKMQPNSTVLVFKPDNLAHVALKAWYKLPESLLHMAQLITGTFSADRVPLLSMPHHINLLTIKQIRSRHLREKKISDIMKICGMIAFTPDKLYIYLACPDSSCNKMVQVAERAADGLLYRLNVMLSDMGGGKHWITTFNGVTWSLFSIAASDMMEVALRPENCERFAASLRQLGTYVYLVMLQISTVTEGPYKGSKNWIVVKIDWEGANGENGRNE
ncbi:hypothetical protein CALCODRAFT_507090 [Calocera cornea HHB12733]|uniref:Uncharacterized protein n=1 Tax=Calocera cornea HHB12733 TaxID=1353952 RepID=A0A165I453_9BASI|nr:hypothetical protein CALCODRAFT_507090 [Calocera cornea HHB12733]